MMDYSQTGPNRISYSAETPAYRSALRPAQIKHSASQDTAIIQISNASINCYKYRALDATKREIRLIHLLPRLSPAEDDHLVRCRIEHASLDDNPTYAALSYSWGPEQPPCTIILEGKVFQVGENLVTALEHLQHHGDEFDLWVDAICINQKGHEDEKGQQLQLIGTIFSGAAIVLAWLGAVDAANDSDTVMKTLDCWGKAYIFSMPTGNEFDDASKEFISTERANISLNHIEAISKFFHREWWYRAWILQEIELADDVIMICGDLGTLHGVMLHVYDAISRFGLETRADHPSAEIARSVGIKLLWSPPRILTAASLVRQP